jgi:hypothetical protein
MTLRRTGLRLYAATRTFSTPATFMPEGSGLAPDVRIVPTVADVLRGDDPVLEYAVSRAP